MWKALQRRDIRVRILLGVVIGIVGVGMLLYLIPGQGTSTGTGTDTVAQVGERAITLTEVRQQMQRIERSGNIPAALRPLYAQQILNQLAYQRMIDLEAQRLGIRVTDQERAERIRMLLPDAVAGGSFVGMERYEAEVQARFQIGVGEFEELVRQGMLEEKLRRLVTAGVEVTPEEVQEEFRRREEKVTIAYVLIKPEQLESKVPVSDAELSSYFEKNKARYVVPERRVVRYAVLDLNQLRQRATPSDEELRAYYNEHLNRFQIENRAHVEHILFKTVGKTDAEIEEIRKRAEEVLKKAKRGTKFEDLAKQYSEDTTKEKGGDLGWIVQQQTVPEFEKVAFSLPKGAVSDLVRTQYGFHIIKVLERENARTQSFDEVRASILSIVTGEKADRLAADLTDQIAAAIRKGTRGSLDDLAKQFNMTIGETRPLAAKEPALELGSAPEVSEEIFRLRPGDLSPPLRSERGVLVLTVKEVQPSHQGSLGEVRDQVQAEYRREKAVEMAKARAEELAGRGEKGENLAAAAKALGFEEKSTEAFARTGSVPEVGSARQLSLAFTLPVGKTSPAVALGSNWIIFRVSDRQEGKPEEFEKQRKELEQQVLQNKRAMTYEAFRAALEERLKREGTYKINADNLRRLSTGT